MILHEKLGNAVLCIVQGIFAPEKAVMESFPKDYEAT